MPSLLQRTFLGRRIGNVLSVNDWNGHCQNESWIPFWILKHHRFRDAAYHCLHRRSVILSLIIQKLTVRLHPAILCVATDGIFLLRSVPHNFTCCQNSTFNIDFCLYWFCKFHTLIQLQTYGTQRCIRRKWNRIFFNRTFWFHGVRVGYVNHQ